MFFVLFFVFKQKTAYEMRISDWSSDVCSSDLQDDDILLVLDETLGLFDHHFGDLDVARRGLVEGRGDDFAVHAALHVGDFLGPFVDQQDDQIDLGMVVGDRLGDILQQHRSEEHTSELQSLMRISYAVFCLKKKKTL